jgi:hypothetical protein
MGGVARAFASNGSTAATPAVAAKGGSTPVPNWFAGRTGGRVAFAGAFRGGWRGPQAAVRPAHLDVTSNAAIQAWNVHLGCGAPFLGGSV